MVRKAVFPVAGLGTRFLPATKANPKEMMPVVDKPLIQYAVEEAIDAGITELIFVTSSSKRAIEDHFDSSFELEHKLIIANKGELLNIVRNILPPGITCSYVRQHESLGLGHAISCARHLIGNEPFAVLLADDLIINHKQSCLKQMLKNFKENNCQGIVAVENIPLKLAHLYGIVDVINTNSSLMKIKNVVEKPSEQFAPSSYGVVGRYILPPEIFNVIEKLPKKEDQEVQLTDAIDNILNTHNFYAYIFAGKRYDCGDKLGYLQAIVSLGLEHPLIGKDFAEFLDNLNT